MMLFTSRSNALQSAQAIHGKDEWRDSPELHEGKRWSGTPLHIAWLHAQKAFIEYHNEDLRFYTQAEAGTSFYIELPTLSEAC